MTAVEVSTVRWSCSRKVGYATKGKARAAKRRMERETGEKFTEYRCLFCDRWHIAHRRRNHVQDV